jgi:microcompartment protein CcmL/EutN
MLGIGKAPALDAGAPAAVVSQVVSYVEVAHMLARSCQVIVDKKEEYSRQETEYRIKTKYRSKQEKKYRSLAVESSKKPVSSENRFFDTICRIIKCWSVGVMEYWSIG